MDLEPEEGDCEQIGCETWLRLMRDNFGLCPPCHRQPVQRHVGYDNFMCCDPCRVFWYIDEPLFLPREAIPSLRAKLTELDTLLMQRLFSGCNDEGQTRFNENRLLSAKETAARLRMSVDYVYKNKFPFAVKQGRRVLFSERGLEQYLQAKMKRNSLDV